MSWLQDNASLRQRFEKKFIVDLTTGCWLWMGTIYGQGYGACAYKTRLMRAHQVSYLIYKGSVPDGMELDHTCHNGKNCRAGNSCLHRRCVNPDHLEAVEHIINCRRGDAQAKFTQTECIRGHPFSGYNLRLVKNKKKVCRTCCRDRAREYRIRKAVKCGIARG